MSVQGRAYMQLIGWQNTWEQAPGVPAIPAQMAGVSPAVYLCTRPKIDTPAGMSSTCPRGRMQNLHGFLHCQGNAVGGRWLVVGGGARGAGGGESVLMTCV